MADRRLTWTVLVLFLLGLAGTIAYERRWSAAAQSRRVVTAFVEAAAAGERADVESLLAADARMTAADAIGLFASYRDTEVADVRGLPGAATDVRVGMVVSYTAAGVPVGTNVLLKQEQGRWVIVDAGPHVAGN